MAPIGIFGGTFDPIHYGHLRTALELLEALSLGEVRFIPSARPPHRAPPRTDAALRLRMVRAAIEEQSGFLADDREITRPGPSYTVDTLASVARDHPGRPLCLLLGMDALLGLPKWHRWKEILELAHVVVAHRPGWRVPQKGELGALVAERRTANAAELSTTRAGRIHVHAVTPLEISSTALRDAIRSGADPRYLMPDSVRRIILDTGCYAREAQGETSTT
jgi:nicotinate-nucleotide adenylyltransferase